MAALAMIASTTGPVESSSSSPVTTSTATTCSGIGRSSSGAVEVLGDEPAQAGVGDEVGARPEEAEQAAERVEGEDLAAPDPAPDRGQLVGGIDGLRAGRDERAVNGPGGGRDDQVGLDAALIQRAQHADLDRAEPGAAGEDEGASEDFRDMVG